MINKPTIHTFLDNRNNQMVCRDSNDFFECKYDPDQKGTQFEFFSGLRQRKKDSVFYCGSCKRPLKISGGNLNGKKRFHFQHLTTPEKGECEYFDNKHMTKDEIKAMIFYGRVEGAKHKAIKDLIARTLEQDPSIRHVEIEKVAKNIGKAWRKPDIRAEYSNRTIVFEVQLSPIFHDVIMERNNDYRSNNWYICWVFDAIDENTPLLRILDAWENNNYNILIFDETAIQKTTETGILYFTVKYTRYSLSDNGEDTFVQSEWVTELVPFNSLTFDEEKMMIYLFDSQKQKTEKEAERDHIIKEAKIRKQLLGFIRDIPTDSFPDYEHRMLLERLDKLDSEEIDCLLHQVKAYLSVFNPDALNKWLEVVHKIYDKKQSDISIDIELLLKYLWNQTEYVFKEKGIGLIKNVALIDYINIFGIEVSFNALTFLEKPFDIRTVKQLNLVHKDHEQFDDYYPLIVLNCFIQSKGYLPSYLREFLGSSLEEFWFLASIVAGKPMGLYKNCRNLKEVVNTICQYYPHVSRQALYLVNKFNRTEELMPTANNKRGKPRVSHYERLQKCAKETSNSCKLSKEDLDILFIAKR